MASFFMVHGVITSAEEGSYVMGFVRRLDKAISYERILLNICGCRCIERRDEMTRSVGQWHVCT